MNIHEYQAKKLFAAYDIPVPAGDVIFTPEDAKDIADKLDGSGKVYVVKAQIHAGGRGKAGGVKLTRDPREVAPLAASLLGKVLVTHQTGPAGREVKKVLIEEGVEIARELYLALVVDRAAGVILAIASTEGGMEIEEVASYSPEKIITFSIDPLFGYQPYIGRRIALGLSIDREATGGFVSLLGNLYRLFVEKGASQIEVNPLIITKEKRVLALDAKVAFDDNALFRHDDIRSLRDLSEEEPLEVRASQYSLSYVKLSGNIGCMVNGAGLAMATMDIIKLAGGEPANFLDVGGGASKETVAQAFSILLADSNVRGIFVNIFGGIVRCERIAGGIMEAAREVRLSVPVVIRLEGTNAKEAKEMLAGSGLPLEVAESFWDGAQRIVARVE